jgi:DNA-binding response OmpR family regulator
MDGFVVLPLLVTTQMAEVPIIMITHLMTRNPVDGVEAGADDFLSKPFTVLS